MSSNVSSLVTAVLPSVSALRSLTDFRTAGVTLRLRLSRNPPKSAVRLVPPVAKPRNTPGEGMSTTLPEPSVISAAEVRSWLEPSVKKPVTWNLPVVPAATELGVALNSMPSKVALVTVSKVETEMLSTEAVMLVRPGEEPVTVPSSATVATAGAEEENRTPSTESRRPSE